jgi:hypothetical protein
MNPKKNYRRYRVSVSIHDLDSSICRSTHSLGPKHAASLAPSAPREKFLRLLSKIQ